jgi:polysaccharide export outer membrane protein
MPTPLFNEDAGGIRFNQGIGADMEYRVAMRGLTAVGALFVFAGCGIMPTSGPSSTDVRAQRSDTSLHYGVVPLTPETTSILAKYEPKGLAGAFRDSRPPAQIRFGVGDVVSVTIFEAQAGGLFIPAEAGVRPGNFVQIPDQTVDNDGNISVPFAGTIRAAGMTSVQIQNEIVQRIRNRAIDPQVVVNLSQQRTSLISVLGDVNAPVRYPAASSGARDRLLDAITRAGGIKSQGYESWVTLERNGRRATAPIGNLVYEPKNNIYVQPGDQIFVYREPQRFLAFGASGQQGQFAFEAWRISLAEAVAKAGGISDGQGDPGSVFLYRRVPREVAAMLGVDVSKHPGETVPVIFSVSFRDPGGYFLATKVWMRHEDVIFVANAPAVEVTKFLVYLNIIMATGGNAINVTNDALILRNNIRSLR